jgi:hypothetical protein
MTDEREPTEKLPAPTCEAGDIVQITDQAHPWFPAVLVVDEVKVWGVQAYVLMPESNVPPSSCSQAFNRLRWGTFERVGAAVIRLG